MNDPTPECTIPVSGSAQARAAEACYAQGLAAQDCGRMAEAADCFRAALSYSPDEARFHFSLGNAYHDLGRPEDALACYEAAARLDPGCAEIRYNMGVVHLLSRRFEAAAAALRIATETDPQMAVAHHHRGLALQALGRSAEALTSFRQAVDLNPDYAEAHCNMGRLLFDKESWDEALLSFQRAIECRAGYVEAWHNLGLCHHKQKRLDAARSCYEKVLALKPDHHRAHIDMGNVFLDRGELERMTGWYRKALEYTPQDDDAVVNVANMLLDQGCLGEARDCYEAVLARNPEHVQAHFQRALVLLKTGDFAQGWKEYEWRFMNPDWRKAYPYRLSRPRWDGERCDGKTLLVHAEQGFGDTLQFARYLPMVKARGARVLFETHPPLKPLFQGFAGVDDVLELSPAGMTARDHDLQVPLLSLPRIFDTTPARIPADVPYLFADPAKAAVWGRRFSGGGLKVGVVWAASGWTRGLAEKSCRLADFLPLAQVPGVRLFGLQKGAASSEAAALPTGMQAVNLGEEFADFADTAAAVAHLDLVISVDTAVAHLAGAMGRPVWVLLPLVGDWRWLQDRADTPWYPTMRLFRQARKGRWEEVFRRVAEELEKMAAPAGVTPDQVEDR